MESDSDSDTVIISDIERACLRILPNLKNETKEKLLTKLEELGVCCEDDLTLVTEGDIQDILKPIDVRKWSRDCIKVKQDISSIELCPRDSSSPISRRGNVSSISSNTEEFSSFSSQGGSSSQEDIPVPAEPVRPSLERSISLADSGHLGDINWTKVPNRVKKYLQNKERLPPSERKALVRFIVDDITCDGKPYPRTPQLRIVAAKAVSKYPKSLMDLCDGDTVGSGYDSLLNQLVNRVDNISRPVSQASLKMKVQLKDGKPSKRKMMDSYGCVRWQPEGLPTGQTEETQKDIMKKLQDKFTKNENGDEVQADMMLTYTTQRMHINSRDHLLSDILVKWPYLFQEKYLIQHCNNLLDIDIMDKMKMAYETKVPKLLRYLADQPKSKEIVEKIEKAKQKKEDNTPEIIGALFALGAYFQENVEKMIVTMPPDQKVENISYISGLPSLISHGQPLTACVFSLSIEKEITTEVHNPLAATCIWFGAYYVFNLNYPVASNTVLEFIQRVMLGINPEKGSKKSRTSRGKKPTISAKVLQITNALTNFENEWALNQ